MAENPQYRIQVYFGAGIAPMDFSYSEPPPGAWEVLLADTKEYHSDKSGKTSIQFEIMILEEPANGVCTRVNVGTDFAKAGNFGHLSNLCGGLHSAKGEFPKKEKFTGKTDITPGWFEGMRAYVIVKAAPEGELDDQGKQVRASVNFATREQYQSYKKAQSFAPVKTPAAKTLHTVATPPIPPSSPAVISGPVSGVTPAANGQAEKDQIDLFGP